MKNVGWYAFAFFAIVIGTYPFNYLWLDMSQGLLSSKPEALRSSLQWRPIFYIHIYIGGVALLAGWSQFSKKFRNRYLRWHRLLGKIYVSAVMLSGVAGFYLSFYATGGLITGLGFGCLAVLWISTTAVAFLLIRNKKTEEHQQWMIRSYSLCFAAVTLRLWMPFFQFGLGVSFIQTYYVIAWLCWVPNLIIAERIVRRRHAGKLVTDT